MKTWKTSHIKGDHRSLEAALNDGESPKGYALKWVLPVDGGWVFVHLRNWDGGLTKVPKSPLRRARTSPATAPASPSQD